MQIHFHINCLKSVRLWNFSGPYFPAFGLNTERYEVSLRIQSECRKIRTRKIPNMDIFHAETKFFKIKADVQKLTVLTYF